MQQPAATAQITLVSMFTLASVAAIGASRPVPLRPDAGPTQAHDRAAHRGLSATHRAMLRRILEGATACPGGAPTCFAPGTDDEVAALFNAAVTQAGGDRYNQVQRWGETALGRAGAQGDPIVLTWSFAPDGTQIPSGVGEQPGPSQLFAYMNSIYGSPQVWQPLYARMFARWSELTGMTFVYEPNDDGAPFFAAEGVPGVRGDLRMAGRPIDGPVNALAYNFYPASGGDMVIDTSDTVFTNTANDSRLLRNVLTHEHGHGMGQNHVCPINQTKIMEPATPLLFDGPDHDAIRSAQRFYGDPYEPDNSAAAATNLGTLDDGASVFIGTTPPPIVPFSSVLSIDANGEQDWFRFSVPSAKRVAVTVTPVGLSYDDSDQACSGGTLFCCSGSITDSRRIADLALQVRAPDGVTVLGAASAQGLGFPESVSAVLLPGAGDYFVRVYETSDPLETQMYTLTIGVSAGPCPGDANDDGVVDFNDLGAVIVNWLNSYAPGTGPGDANADGTVDFEDITRVLERWLQPCP